MLRFSVISFIFSLVAVALGITNTAGVSFELGRFLFLIMLGLALLTFFGSLVSRPGNRARPARTA